MNLTALNRPSLGKIKTGKSVSYIDGDEGDRTPDLLITN